MKRKLSGKKGSCINLLDAFEMQISQKLGNGNLRTADNYRSTVNKLQVYQSGRLEDLTLDDVTDEWVLEFVDWLKKKHPNKPQTADFYFRNLRALFHGACKKYKIKKTDLPFKDVTFLGRPSAKRALSKDEVNRLISPAFYGQLKECLRESYDILHFMLFMRGMVFQDLYNLTWDMVDSDNHIHYLRSKTQVPINTELSPEALKIIERYREEGSIYVFPFLHQSMRKDRMHYISEQSAIRRVNRHAAQIGKLAGLPIPLTTYVMRHTFATLMIEASKPVELISQCLGHASIRTTELYISRISKSKVDKEVNDMFNQLLRPAITKKKKSNRSSNIKKPKEENSPLPVIIESDKHTAEQTETTVEAKKYPFLHKKETSRSEITFLHKISAAKIHILSNIANIFLTLF